MAAAAAAAAGVLGAAYISSRAANKATKRQAHADDAALDYQKEQDQYVRSKYEKQEAREDEARAAYRQYLAANGKGPAGGSDVAAPQNTSPVAMAARAAVSAPGYSAQPTIRDLAPAGAPAPGPVSGPPVATAQSDVSSMPTIGDTSRWNEWAPYLTQAQA